MSKRRPIIVWKNGKKTKMRRLKINDNKPKHSFKKDSDEKNNRKPDSFIHPISISKNRHNKQRVSKRVKTVIVAFLSAIIIGTILGFIMLHMMTNINGSYRADSSTNVNEVKSNSANATTSIELEEMNAYVVQAGVFSETSNAKEWAITYEEAGLQTVTWEREDHYYLLIGLTSTLEEARQLEIELQSYGFDFFIKEWKTNSQKINTTDEESQWIEAFQTKWQETLKNIYEENELTVDGWQQLLREAPSENQYSNVHEILAYYFKESDMQHASEHEIQIMLLNMWKEFEQVLETN